VHVRKRLCLVIYGSCDGTFAISILLLALILSQTVLVTVLFDENINVLIKRDHDSAVSIFQKLLCALPQLRIVLYLRSQLEPFVQTCSCNLSHLNCMFVRKLPVKLVEVDFFDFSFFSVEQAVCGRRARGGRSAWLWHVILVQLVEAGQVVDSELFHFHVFTVADREEESQDLVFVLNVQVIG